MPAQQFHIELFENSSEGLAVRLIPMPLAKKPISHLLLPDQGALAFLYLAGNEAMQPIKQWEALKENKIAITALQEAIIGVIANARAKRTK